MSRTLKIVRAQFSEHGFVAFAAVMLKSLFKVDRISIYAKDLTKNGNRNESSDLAADVRKGDQIDLENIRNKTTAPAWEFSCDLYDGVKDFFVYQKNESVGHISWVYYKNDPNRIIDLQINEAEVKYSLTLPDLRGKGIYPAVLREVQYYLKSKGFKKLFICTLNDNLPSVRGIEKSDFIFVTTISLIKIFGVQISRRYATNQ